jgi:hypothetical protein
MFVEWSMNRLDPFVAVDCINLLFFCLVAMMASTPLYLVSKDKDTGSTTLRTRTRDFMAPKQFLSLSAVRLD